MAVYTPLSESQVAAFIAPFGFTQVLSLKATDAGIENTNYFVTALDRHQQTCRLVLTLFEMMPESELPYFVALTSFLAQEGLPVPAPYRNAQGQAILPLQNKPAILVPCFTGSHPATPTIEQCGAIAGAMARMHLASPRFSARRANDRGAQWREQAIHTLQPFLHQDQKTLLLDQVADWRLHQGIIDTLPCGINHHDLFHDNALFEGDQLTGIIDFYNACDDVFIYDLAVLVNDWCSDEQGQLIAERYHAVMTSYTQLRPLSADEQTLWPRMLAYAALRFWISRLLSWHDTDQPHNVAQKDPRIMQRMLLARLHALT
ncbi:MAG: homoserine kinase [Pseudomonadales bacterium]|jgi:homoserine kinase type II|uniref:homoserine kinase n=1 Tax=unclassified Ketobacter TaxID=2639109 RepID=UPI000C51C54B|nr:MULTISPECIES: homoserine kinase [unclassified Ketobacter]MAA58509.1 homoserine kinase [Pseudomonadales bacterium]MEC8811467.1 homoserine kinase [Pseudomonadota bacterium]HAG96919.1 homoserine kinase [Gammaproteobacteria bacterium]MAQ23163.1 homoserine kinase [Pseudomonadales bacterium]MBI27788.1 homoserine kinase [Pseudomonadales bacterium]|tara:strand:+ start:48912 stop:49862 length:951 start_codon:yes stop_codon:yes gene_type:complete